MAKWLAISAIMLLTILGIAWLLSKQNAVIAPTSTPATTTVPTNPTTPAPDTQHPLIRVSTPLPGQPVTSPLSVRGEARGNWFFEASFPVELLDANGVVLAKGIATAEGEWMTTEFVPFKAVLEFMPPASGTSATLLLKKDNPSGLPENDDQLAVPILF